MGLGGNGLCHCVAEKTNGHPTSRQERITTQLWADVNSKHSPVQVRLGGAPYKLLTEVGGARRSKAYSEMWVKKKKKRLQHCGWMIGNECSVVNFRVTRAFGVILYSCKFTGNGTVSWKHKHKHDSGEWEVEMAWQTKPHSTLCLCVADDFTCVETHL